MEKWWGLAPLALNDEPPLAIVLIYIACMFAIVGT